MIAGGDDKNTSLDEFYALVNERVDNLILVGERLIMEIKILNLKLRNFLQYDEQILFLFQLDKFP